MHAVYGFSWREWRHLNTDLKGFFFRPSFATARIVNTDCGLFKRFCVGTLHLLPNHPPTHPPSPPLPSLPHQESGVTIHYTPTAGSSRGGGRRLAQAAKTRFAVTHGSSGWVSLAFP